MKYQIVKGLTGSSVKYTCDGCQTDLRSPLADAGKKDTCPTCRAELIVPGAKELERRKRLQARKEQAKAEAKERKQREREEQKQLAIAAEQEKRRQDEVRLMQEIEAANAMKQNLRQALDDVSFNLVDHDWSSGAPWVYECVEMGTLSFAWNEELSRIINRKAQEGWEYFRSESLVASRPAGCLGALFGGGPAFFNVVVLVFRRPAVIAKVERHYGVT